MMGRCWVEYSKIPRRNYQFLKNFLNFHCFPFCRYLKKINKKYWKSENLKKFQWNSEILQKFKYFPSIDFLKRGRWRMESFCIPLQKYLKNSSNSHWKHLAYPFSSTRPHSTKNIAVHGHSTQKALQ